MKMAKRILSLVLVLAMVACLGVTAFADTTYSSNKSTQIWDYMCCYNVKADEVVELVYDFTVSEWTTTTPLA